MPAPSQVTFEEDFLAPVLGRTWITSASGSGCISVASGQNGPGGVCLLYTYGGTQGAARIHQGADGAIIPGTNPPTANDAPALDCRTWSLAKNIKIEARVAFNMATQDAGFTIGLVGPRDPENVLCAEYSGSWYLQARKGNHEAPIEQEGTGFNHQPGSFIDFCIEATATQATLSINGKLVATVTDIASLPTDPMAFEFQCWNLPPNHAQATMYVDWVKITQDR